MLVLTGAANQAGVEANSLLAGVQLRADQTVGLYEMCNVQFTDVAGNLTLLKSDICGGNVNFSNYFSTGTTIFVNQ